MKKSIVILGVIALAGFSSCKKDWTCLCTDQSGNQSSTLINDETLLNARAKCKSMDYSTTIGGVTTSESCALQ
jgi:hypothetical protein